MDAATQIVNSKTNLRPLLRLALPVVIEQLMIMLVTWTDHYLTAQYLETHHLAAINLMAYVLWVLPIIHSCILIPRLIRQIASLYDFLSA